ncbi:MAG: hypothetical protein QOC83_256, partial [Pseudonocardiales bacterium]|nr:hypothetical protein [Pseudonocardiales bacterium]
MADFAPQRGGQPIRSVVTVADLLGRRPGSAGTQDGRAPGARTAVSVGALIRREVAGPDGRQRPLDPRLERAFVGLSSSPRRKLATSAGAMLAVGSLAGAAALLGHTVPGPAGSSALDGGYPENGIFGGPGSPFGGGIAGLNGGLAGGSIPNITPLAFPTPAGPVNPARLLPSPGQGTLAPAAPTTIAPGVGPVTPAPATAAPATGSSSAPAGGAVGGVVDDVVSGVGGGLGGTVSGVADALDVPVVSPLLSGVGGVVTDTTRVLGGAVDNTVGA